MIIKDTDLSGALVRKFSKFKRRGLWAVGIVTALAVSFGVGAALQREGILGPFVQGVLTNKNFPVNYLRGQLAKPETMVIDINFKNYQKLAYKRQMALANGYLTTDSDSYVPADIHFRGVTTSVRLRLKGDLLDHLQGEKWSFRVKTRGEQTLWGMKRFSLHHPQTREYIFEWLFYRALRLEGLIALRYEFVNVTINGKDRGLYALEESFEKRLLENNTRREGPILKFDETNWWTESEGHVRDYGLPGAGHYNSLPVDMFQTGKVLADSALFGQFQIGLNLLERFRSGELSASKVFEVKTMSAYLALCDLLGAFHALNTIQLRFYYNPVTSLLEIIPFDANAGKRTPELAANHRSEEETPWKGQTRALFTQRLFADTAFYRLYLQELQRVSQPEYLESLLLTVGDSLQYNLDLIYSDFPGYIYSLENLHHNQRMIQRFLNPVQALNAYYSDSGPGWVELEIGSSQQLPVIVESVLALSSDSNSGVSYWPTEEIFLPARRLTELIDHQRFRFTLSDNNNGAEYFAETLGENSILQVNYHLLGTDSTRVALAHLWSQRNLEFLAEDFIRRETNLKDIPWLKFNEGSKTITIKPGFWKVSESVIIPAGFEIRSSGGVTLDLTNSAKIVSYSPVYLNGSAEEPIRFISSDSTGQGLAVFSAAGSSLLHYVTFENLAAPSQSGWELTGAVTFFESPVEISHCFFNSARAEDALNIIKSDYSISACSFVGGLSDAFDSDFSAGTITATTFTENGNDAIDISGSQLTIENVKVSGAGDKALSVGEASVARIKDFEALNSKIAIAAKDNSTVSVSSLIITGGEIGFAVFQKKSEFGPASIEAKDLTVKNLSQLFLLEESSTLIIDGQQQRANQESVRKLLYAAKYGAPEEAATGR